MATKPQILDFTLDVLRRAMYSPSTRSRATPADQAPTRRQAARLRRAHAAGGWGLDGADLALLADPKLRDRLSARWTEGMSTWFGDSHDPLVAARLVADGAWIDRCRGLLDLDEAERSVTAAVVAPLIEVGSHS